MKLYRIDWEWDEYQGAGEYKTKKYYEYVLGNAALGRTIYEGIKEDERPIWICKLSWTIRAFLACLTHVRTSIHNYTKYPL